MSFRGSVRIRISAVLLPALGALAGCRQEPSAQDIGKALTDHPEILTRAIEQHPAEIIAALNKAAQSAQLDAQRTAQREAAAKEEAEFRTPRVPALDHRVAFGNPKAPITIVEYSDFECPYCRRERDVLVQVMRKYGDSVRLVLKQLPIDLHPHARISALMYEAVAKQDPAKAFKLYDELFNNQDRLQAQGETYLEQAIRTVGADLARAKADAQSPEIRALVDADIDEARRFGYTGTPGFLINGVSFEGSHPLATFERIIDRHLAGRSGAAPAPAPLPAR